MSMDVHQQNVQHTMKRWESLILKLMDVKSVIIPTYPCDSQTVHIVLAEWLPLLQLKK